MRALVVYESMFDNTEAIARVVGSGLASKLSTDVHEVRAAPRVLPASTELLIFGGPTVALGMSRVGTRERPDRRVTDFDGAAYLLKHSTGWPESDGERYFASVVLRESPQVSESTSFEFGGKEAVVETLLAIDEIDTLRRRLDHLTLVSEALWSFLQDQGYTQEQLADRIERIDLSDGRLDRRHVHRVMCINCGAAITTDQCQFCGARVDDPFASA